MQEPSSIPLLELRDIHIEFPVSRSIGDVLRRRPRESLHAVDGVDMRINEGETLGLVGESGCGKSTLGRCIVGLTDAVSGEVVYKGCALPAKRARAQRRHIQMVFQDPYSSLNPRMTARDTLAELLTVHDMVPRERVAERCAELVVLVGLAPRVLDAHPRQLSGGQRQRVAIARALALEPELLIADEPVSALDVSVQATVLNLLDDIRRRLQMTMLFVSHNMAVVRHISDRVAVMYLGRIVEVCPTAELFLQPRHPYTRALLAAVPSLRRRQRSAPCVLVGDPPSPVHLPEGCRFHPRCAYAQPICRQVEPGLAECADSPQRSVACHFPCLSSAADAETGLSACGELSTSNLSGEGEAASGRSHAPGIIQRAGQWEEA